MPVKVDLQNDEAFADMPSEQLFHDWVNASLLASYRHLEQTIRIVDEAESNDLNQRYRGKDAPTNVLAFPADADYLDYDCLGDLVICAPVVSVEAATQGKTAEAHWAHLVVHGMLHLQGYDHQETADTREMECLEIKILDTLGFANPYND